MDTAVAVIGWVVAWAFVWSAAVKWRDVSAVAMTIAAFSGGTAIAPRRTLGTLYALAETLLATALVVGLAGGGGRPLLTAAMGSAAALAAVLAAVGGRAVARGRRFPCRCFGADAELSWTTVVRAGAIAVAALTVAVAGPSTGDALRSAAGGMAILGMVAMTGGLVAVARPQDDDELTGMVVHAN